MIVRTDGNRLLLVTQPDHAGLAADLLGRWTAGGLPGRPTRSLVLYAARQHDNGWLEPDAAPGVGPDGRPYDFLNAPEATRRAIWPRAIARLGRLHPVAGAHVGQHALTVYRSHAGEPDWADFFAGLEADRDRLLEAGGLDGADARAEFLRDYRFIFLSDLASLVFCNGWTDPIEAEGYRFILLGDTLTISPDPFDGARVDLRVRARAIADRRYESDADLRRGLAGGVDCWLTGAAVGS